MGYKTKSRKKKPHERKRSQTQATEWWLPEEEGGGRMQSNRSQIQVDEKTLNCGCEHRVQRCIKMHT